MILRIREDPRAPRPGSLPGMTGAGSRPAPDRVPSPCARTGRPTRVATAGPRMTYEE